MKLIPNLSLFLTIVEQGSLVSAGKALGLSSTTVSERLSALERHYGVVLLNRTTRSMSLTDEGRALVEGARHLLDEAAELESIVRNSATTLTGLIRVSAPRDLGHTIVSDVMDTFLKEHPAVSFELLLSDGYLNIVGEGIDLAVRYGPIPDSTLRSKRIAERHRIVCAAPRYLERHGVPERPKDLEQHNCLLMRFGPDVHNVWRFGSSETVQLVRVKGNRIADDGLLVRRWCVEGLGIAFKSELDVFADIKAGRLMELLSDFRQAPLPLQIMFPPARRQAKRVGVFAAALERSISAQWGKEL